MADIQRIPFHDDELCALVDERTGTEYVLPKPMVELFGLRWQAQLAKLTKSKLFRKGIQKIVIPTPGGPQEAVVLERRLVHAWLLSIDIRRVNETLQAKLLRYQEECGAVLDAYFTHGAAINPRAVDVTGPWDMLAQMVEAGRHQEEKMRALEAQQQEQLLATIENQRQALEALARSSRAETKADMALDEAHRMTLEDFVCKNGLLRQFPPPSWAAAAKWLGDFCQAYSLAMPKVPVVGKPWLEEKSYPLQALAAWQRYETTKPRQVALVPPQPERG